MVSKGMKGTLYLAGPMSGLPDFNFPAFNSKADELRHEGWVVTNPADFPFHEGWEWHQYLRVALRAMTYCDTIYMLRGWQQSRGANLEYEVAVGLGMKVLLEQVGPTLFDGGQQ